MGRHAGARATPGQKPKPVGFGQLTLVEHALCPLDSRESLRDGLKHETTFRYSRPDGQREEATVRIDCAYGLSASDEFYLWGLLALTLAQPSPSTEFEGTPGYCLRHLGVPKGGKSYRLLRESLERLAGVRYRCDRFYDPIRQEHRRVAFGLLGLSLPTELESARLWRFVWDQQFFEFARAASGGRWFDLSLYRELDPASRRLWLLLSKRFHRRHGAQRFGLRRLAVQGLGFADSMSDAALRKKVRRCAEALQAARLLSGSQDGACRFSRPRGVSFVFFSPGERVAAVAPLPLVESPLRDPLLAIGFRPQEVGGILKRYPDDLVARWSDVTLAAIEHHGPAFFTRNPQAHLVDNLKGALEGRQPPDWYLALKKTEREGGRRKRRPAGRLSRALDPELSPTDAVQRLIGQN